MKRFALSRHQINSKELLRTKAKFEDTLHIFTEPGLYCLDGEPVIIYGKLPQDDKMLWAVQTLDKTKESRSTASSYIHQNNREKLGESRIFGYRPRVPISCNYCSISSSAVTHPEQHNIICEFGKRLTSLYQRHAPKVFNRHLSQVESLSDEWVLPDTVFTSGIVNANNPLKYHFDSGNFADVMSCMVVFRQLCDGGLLSIPEFNAKWLLCNNSYFLFDGQKFLHGVTPIHKMNKNGYRYSVVYYALKGMQKCGTLEQEISRARAAKRKIEKNRLIVEGDDL